MIVNVSGFSIGILPFRYLGVINKLLNASDFEALIDKMTSRIKVW